MSQPTFVLPKLHGHPLAVRVFDPNTSTAWGCDGCNRNNVPGPRFSCTQRCNYDLCHDCVAKGPVLVSQVHPHVLNIPHYTANTAAAWACDVCSAVNPTGNRYHCESDCNWDACQKCVMPVAAIAHAPAPPSHHEHHAPACGAPRKTNAPATVVIAGHPHRLYIPVYNANTAASWACDLCNAVNPSGVHYKCAQGCNWDSCEKCVLKGPLVAPIHPHQLVVPVFTANTAASWGCDVCSAVNPAGRYQCSKGCNWDVCQGCLGKTAEKTYGFIENMSGLVLDIKGEQNASGAPLIAWVKKHPSCDNQLWYIDGNVIRSKLNRDLVLDVKGAKTAAGTPILAYKHHGKANQCWHFDGISLVSHCGNANMVLDIGGEVKQGNCIVLGAPSPSKTSQQWFFVPV